MIKVDWWLTLSYMGVCHYGPPLAVLALVTQGLTSEGCQFVTIPISMYICIIFCFWRKNDLENFLDPPFKARGYFDTNMIDKKFISSATDLCEGSIYG